MAWQNDDNMLKMIAMKRHGHHDGGEMCVSKVDV